MTEPVQTNGRRRELQAEAMDAQHELLTSLMRKLMERDAAGAGKRELALLLGQLETSTAGHFKDEEDYMRDLGHPKLDTHPLIHRDLLVMLRRNVDEFHQGSGRLGCNLISFLKYWLGSHIDGMDRDLAQQCRPLPESASSLKSVKG